MFAELLGVMIVGSAKLLTGARAEWRGCRPENRQRIFVANHTSHLDFVLVWAALPRQVRARTRPVAAADYWERGLVRRYVAKRVFNAVLVTRGRQARPPHTPDVMAAALQHGHSLILFPEGTRGNGLTLQPFKPGVFHLAHARTDVEIVPVWIENPRRAMPKGSVLPAPVLCSARFGAPVRIGPAEAQDAFIDRLRRAVEELAKV